MNEELPVPFPNSCRFDIYVNDEHVIGCSMMAKPDNDKEMADMLRLIADSVESKRTGIPNKEL